MLHHIVLWFGIKFQRSSYRFCWRVSCVFRTHRSVVSILAALCNG